MTDEPKKIDKRKTNPFLFKPGQSGNPAGPSPRVDLEKTANHVKQMAAKATPLLMKEMINIALDAETPKQTKLLYIKEIMDRGIGKTPKPIEVKTQDVNNPMNVLSDMGKLFIGKIQTVDAGIVDEAKALPEPPVDEDGEELPPALDDDCP